MTQIKEISMLVVAMVLAGSSVVVGKVLIDSLPVFLGAFGSLFIAFFCMVPLMRNRMAELSQLSQKQWKYLFLQGLCGIVLFRIFTLYGLHSTGAVQAGIITGTTPAILALLSLCLLGEQLTKRAFLGITFAVAGCVAINIFTGDEGGKNNILGCLLIGAAVVCECLFTIFRKRIADSVSATTNTTVLIFCSMLLLLPPAIWDLYSIKTMPSGTTFLAVAYYGIFATVIAYLLWTAAVGKVSGVTAGATTAAMPASSVILAAFLLGEQVHWYHVTGCALIIAGILISTISPSNMVSVTPE